MEPRMDAAGPVDAKTASTGPWKTAQTAVSHSAHTPSRFHGEDESNRPAHRISDTPVLCGPWSVAELLCSSVLVCGRISVFVRVGLWLNSCVRLCWSVAECLCSSVLVCG